MGTDPYEPIHIALVITLAANGPQGRHERLDSYSSETLARMLAVLYSSVFLESPLIQGDDEAYIHELIDETIGMLISQLDTSNNPF